MQQKPNAQNISVDLASFFTSEPQVKFAYLFGSMAKGVAIGPLSDLDLAVYLDRRVNFFTKRLQLMESIAKKIRTENFDLVVLNRAPVVLQYEVIKNGIVLKENRTRRIMFETEVLRTYLDTVPMREIQYQYLKKSMRKEAGHG